MRSTCQGRRSPEKRLNNDTLHQQLTEFIHRTGVHCESSALRDIFEFHGFRFSEPMIFGLGSGLSFIYWQSKPGIFPFVGGRERNFAENLCANLDVSMKVNKTSSRTKAYDAVKTLIGRNQPVMVHVDMPYLNYLGAPEHAHFGAHTVVIAGINEDADTVYIADTGVKGLQTASLKELEAARASPFKPFPPENRWFTFEFPSTLKPTEAAIKNAVAKTVKSMLHRPIKNLGVEGIRHLANEIEKWPSLFPPEDASLRQFYEVTYIMMNEDGTGGGLFRYLYSRFLREAGELLNSEELVNTSQLYHRIGRKWTDIAKLIREIPKNPVNVKEARNILLDVANEETEALSRVV